MDGACGPRKLLFFFLHWGRKWRQCSFGRKRGRLGGLIRVKEAQGVLGGRSRCIHVRVRALVIHVGRARKIDCGWPFHHERQR